MPAILDKLNALNKSATAEQILPVLNEISARASDYDAVKGFIRDNQNNDRDSMAAPLNVAIAGLTGLVKGSKHLQTVQNKRPVEVNPFLHQLRLAMLKCEGLRVQMRANASQYFFYPEFHAFDPNTVSRLLKVAYAHCEMTPVDTETIPLYSLGGYFNHAETVAGIPKDGGRGTTCIMTARAFYHAAGARMIGEAVPQVTTANGAVVGLGRPAQVVSGQKRSVSATVDVERFTDTNVAPPPLQPGDIYLIAGHGQAQYLMRPGVRDVAVHVGLVVGRYGNKLTTIDGGQGLGNQIHTRIMDLTYQQNWGWSLGNSMSYTVANLDAVSANMAKWDSDAAVQEWIDKDPGGLPYRLQMERLNKQISLATNDVQRKMIEKTRPTIYKQARWLLRERAIQKDSQGGKRTVQGWWRPSMYPELDIVGDSTVLSKLA